MKKEEGNQESSSESSNESEDNQSSSDSEDESEMLRKEMADIPLGEIQKLREKCGLKRYNEVVFGTQSKGSENYKKQQISNINLTVAKQKSAPEEKSSKIRNFAKRRLTNQPKRLFRDPRFDDLSGKYNETMFEKSYSFIEDMRKKEFVTVKKQLKKTKNKDRKADLQKLFNDLERKNKESEKVKIQKVKEKEIKKKQIESGKKVFYLKKSERKKIQLAEKFRELKSSNKLEKYMSKKLKRNAAKEKKKLPNKKNTQLL
ncbi:ribosomal RNA processing protein 36 homolog isoform X1 [Hydra vulgaris]|uniref:ribosomal RNA processing protein 36 homolog isoform X1 n=1 Tax=Hydra vulgaris TaxID=6087 RepID=UPI001F5ECC6B|nr:ribosomal RNA processing protein 36 homolog [Hydra vulgaris]